eukprot:734297-Pleurochrysis_carterae.AAC.6
MGLEACTTAIHHKWLTTRRTGNAIARRCMGRASVWQFTLMALTAHTICECVYALVCSCPSNTPVSALRYIRGQLTPGCLLTSEADPLRR